MAQPVGGRFQFSLGELLVCALFTGLLFLIHGIVVAGNSDLEGKIVILISCMAGFGVGLWRACRLNSEGWHRRAYIAIGMFLAVVLTGFGSFLLCGENSHTCWQCGAVRHEHFVAGFFPVTSIEDWEVSEGAQRILGGPCPHPLWQFGGGFSLMGFRDAFPSYSVPVLKQFYHNLDVVSTLEKVPNKEWARKVLESVGEKNNRLKYVATMAIIDLACCMPRTTKEWNEWWNAHEEVFCKTTSIATALPIAQRLIDRTYLQSIGLTDLGSHIQRDIPGIDVEPWLKRPPQANSQ